MHARILLVALAGALGVGFWFAADHAPKPVAVAAPDAYRVSGPFTHGNLSVFLLHAPDTVADRPVLGLDEALANGSAIVFETGSVNELAVENRSPDADLLLLSGDIVKGGKQDRAIFETQLVPPNSGRVPIKSFCVEQGRWTGRKQESAGKFDANPGVVSGKALKTAVQTGGQGEVWANVAVQQAGLSRTVGMPVNSPESPTSLQLAVENDAVRKAVGEISTAVKKRAGDRPDAIGFVTVVNGRVTGAEAFGSHTLFRKAWAKAVDAAAVEAVAEKTDMPFPAADADDVRAFLASADGRGEHETRYSETDANLIDLDGTFITHQQRSDVRQVENTPLRGHGSSSTRNGRVVSGGGVAGWNPNVGGFTDPEPAGNTRGVLELHLPARSVVRNQGREQFNPFLPSPQMPAPRSEDAAPKTESAKAAVVEYRDRGPNGAVIHRSFLAK